ISSNPRQALADVSIVAPGTRPLLPPVEAAAGPMPAAPDRIEPTADDHTADATSEIEELVARIFERVLEGEHVSAQQSFFELGGHSLPATLAVSRIRQAFGIDVPLRDLFEAPTVAAFASLLRRRLRSGTTSSEPPIERADRTVPLPLSYAQQRLW